jgi:AcrR family transcriptional regulator
MRTVEAALKPRKTPIQARSHASVNAILQATVQVLTKEGVGKITTKRVAARAGVSIGTLYQYFPNKSSLLYVLYRQRLDSFAVGFEQACTQVRGAELTEMAEVLASAFVRTKFADGETSIALYAAAGNCDGCRRMRMRTAKVLADTIATAPDRTVTGPSRVARMLFSAMAGISRDIVAAGMGRHTISEMERELTQLLRACLLGCSTSNSHSSSSAAASYASGDSRKPATSRRLTLDG